MQLALKRNSWDLLFRCGASAIVQSGTCPLVTLKSVINLMPDNVVSKHLFDPMLAGFADSNAKLREETLKSLVFVLDKLEETQIQDKLLRSISTCRTIKRPLADQCHHLFGQAVQQGD